MAVTVLTTKSGNSVGPSSYTQFNVVVQLGYEGTNATGYKMYVRYYVRVSKSSNTSNFTNNLHVSWTDKTYGLSKVGDYAVSDWISLGTKAYGTKVTASANCYYIRNNGETLKSSADASYTIPIPTYTVSYNANGGSGAPNSQTKTHGTNLKLSATKPTRTGYTFQGWGTSTTDTTVDYASGGTYTSNASITLYAIWKIIEYTVTYNANGGSGEPSNQTKKHGVDLTLSTTKPTRTDYNFLGWNTYQTATEPLYEAGDVYKNNSAITLYAVWEVAYIKPRITNFRAYRSNAQKVAQEDGTYITVAFDWETDLTGVYFVPNYKQKEETVYKPTSSVVLSGTSGKVEHLISGVTFSTEYAYNIQLDLYDSHGKSTITVLVNSMFITIDMTPNGENISFGEPAKDTTAEKGMFRVAYTNIDLAPKNRLLYKGEAMFGQKQLWPTTNEVGNSIMNETHSITLTKKISEMKNGILLVFGRDGSYSLSAHFVPKQSVVSFGRTGWTFMLCTDLFDYIGAKTLYISDTKIEGHTNNDATAKNGVSGITYHNEAFYLKYVYEV